MYHLKEARQVASTSKKGKLVKQKQTQNYNKNRITITNINININDAHKNTPNKIQRSTLIPL